MSEVIDDPLSFILNLLFTQSPRSYQTEFSQILRWAELYALCFLELITYAMQKLHLG
jgi:hypothetical protein